MKTYNNIEADTNSLLWNDLYKFTMQYSILLSFPEVKVKYRFFDRKNIKFPKQFDLKLRKIVDNYPNKTISQEKLDLFKKSCPYLPNFYFDFLKSYKYDSSEVGIILQDDGKLDIIIEGYWYKTILWEVPLMSDICELYYKETGQIINIHDSANVDNISRKIESLYLNNVSFTDFGTRRAYSKENHKFVIETILKSFEGKHALIGTSNVELAICNNIKCIGTYAHEYVSGNACLNGYIHANYHTMENWVKAYQGNLGIVLPDTFTTDLFLQDFNSKYARLFDGVRHDSGCPFEFTDKIINHYNLLNINPKDKSIVYSNSLNLESILEINEYRKNEIRKSYGWGTGLTCDLPGIDPMNIVIKLIEVNGMPAIKLSDDYGKHIGNDGTINYVQWQINQVLKIK